MLATNFSITRTITINSFNIVRRASQWKFETFGTNQMSKFFSHDESKAITIVRDSILKLSLGGRDPLLSLVRIEGSECIHPIASSPESKVLSQVISFALHKLAAIDQLGFDVWRKYCVKVPYSAFKVLNQQTTIKPYTVISYRFKDSELQYVKLMSRKLKRGNDTVIPDIINKISSKSV